MAAPMDQQGAGTSNPHLIDELETAFLNCISLLTSQEHFNVQDSDETKISVESAMQKFLELSRQTEAFFLRKRMLTVFQKPEQLVQDDIQELRAELARKDQLLERHSERLKRCQMMLQSGAGVGQQLPQPHPPQQQPIQQQIPQQVPPSHIGPGPGAGPGQGPATQYQPQHPMQMQAQGGPPNMGPGPGPGPGPHYPPGPGQGYPGIHTPPMQAPHPQMQPHPMGMAPRPQAPPSYPAGPLAFLEQTTSNIGMPDRR